MKSRRLYYSLMRLAEYSKYLLFIEAQQITVGRGARAEKAHPLYIHTFILFIGSENVRKLILNVRMWSNWWITFWDAVSTENPRSTRGLRFSVNQHRMHLLGITSELNIYAVICIEQSWDSSVGIATGYGLDGQRSGVRVLVEARIFTSLCRPDRF
jgi:hypothetical protein